MPPHYVSLTIPSSGWYCDDHHHSDIVAFGLPGRLDSRGVSQGDTNVSVIRTDLGRDFSLSAIMKSPVEGASILLDKFLAPVGSGRTATLLDASQRDDGIYQFSYRVQRQQSGSSPNLQAISVLAQKQGVLITLTVVAPEQDWSGEFGSALARVTSSFHLR
jgi:PsbP